MTEKEASDDPFKPSPDRRDVLASVCYVQGCGKIDGCMVVVNKRFVIFQDTCAECDRHEKPDCYARNSAGTVEIAALCTDCAKVTS